MADIPYVCLYMSYLQSLSPFTDAERGRLVTAMMNYAATGEVPQFDGNERFIWPSLQNQIDRDIETYQAKCARNRANGSKGGRPSKNQTVIPETERFLEKPKKPKEKEKEKEKKKEKENEREKKKQGRASRQNPPTFPRQVWMMFGNTVWNRDIQPSTRSDSSVTIQPVNGCPGRQLSQIGRPLLIRGIERT